MCRMVNASRKLTTGSGWQATSAYGATATHRPAVTEGGCGCRSPPTEPQSERGELDVYFLFTRGLGAGNEHFRSEFQRQPAVLGYSMTISAREDLAMVLPLPVPPNSPERAVRFISLEGYPNFFTDMDRGFVSADLRVLALRWKTWWCMTWVASRRLLCPPSPTSLAWISLPPASQYLGPTPHLPGLRLCRVQIEAWGEHHPPDGLRVSASQPRPPVLSDRAYSRRTGSSRNRISITRFTTKLTSSSKARAHGSINKTGWTLHGYCQGRRDH